MGLGVGAIECVDCGGGALCFAFLFAGSEYRFEAIASAAARSAAATLAFNFASILDGASATGAVGIEFVAVVELLPPVKSSSGVEDELGTCIVLGCANFGTVILDSTTGLSLSRIYSSATNSLRIDLKSARMLGGARLVNSSTVDLLSISEKARLKSPDMFSPSFSPLVVFMKTVFLSMIHVMFVYKSHSPELYVQACKAPKSIH
jgi:hypothetical protein